MGEVPPVPRSYKQEELPEQHASILGVRGTPVSLKVLGGRDEV